MKKVLQTPNKDNSEDILTTTNLGLTIFQNSKDCVKILDLEGNLMLMNQPGQELMEIENFSEIKGKPWADFWEGKFNKEAQNAVRKAKNGEMTKFTGSTTTAKGTSKWWEVTVTPIFNTEGIVKQILSISHDITLKKEIEDEKKRLIESLEAEQSKLAEIIELSPAFIAILHGKNHVFDLVNKAYYQLVGHRKIVGKTVLEALPEVKDQGYIELLDAVRKTGNPFIGDEMKVELQRVPNGPLEERYVNLVYQPIKDRKGKNSGIFAHGYDVTEQVIARKSIEASEAAARQSQERLQLITDALPAFVSYRNTKDQYQFINATYEKWFGVSFEETIGKTTEELAGKETADKAREALKEVFEGKSVTYENSVYSKDGRIAHLDVKYVPDIDKKGKVRGFVVLGNDITEKKNAAEKTFFLNKVTQILASSLDQESILSSVAKLLVPRMADWYTVSLFDSEQQLRRVSVFHKNKEKIALADRLLKEYPTDPKSSSSIHSVAKSGDPVLIAKIPDELIEASAKDEEHLQLLRAVGFTSIMVVPLRVRNKIIGTLTLVSAESGKEFTNEDLAFTQELGNRIATAIDNASLFTEAKEAEAAVRKLNTELEQRVNERTKQLEEANMELTRSNAELQDFAYVSSHDLQEPLRKITAFSNLLQSRYRDDLPEQAQVYLDTIKKSSNRMSTLINDLLTFSRVTTQAHPYECIDLNVLIAEALTDLQYRIDESHAEIQVKKLPSIPGDALQIRLLLQNLLSNALKYAKEGITPKIKVYSKLNKNSCTIYVQDNGIGFSEQYLDRIFTIFQRLHGRNEYEGTGIGLAICKKIVERHKGSITAKSTEGVGSTFIVTLPCS